MARYICDDGMPYTFHLEMRAYASTRSYRDYGLLAISVMSAVIVDPNPL